MTLVERHAGSDLRDSDIGEAELRVRLAKTWATKPGIVGALSTVDHKIIGRRYIVTAFVFLTLGGLLAFFMRLQLARPEGQVLGPDAYNQFFSMHGTTMMFLFAVPAMEAFAVYSCRSWLARATSPSRGSTRSATTSTYSAAR
jgi:heme/copper-type cytochrome/quinol oxidase subunit 1